MPGLAYYFQSLHHPLSFGLPIWPAWKPWLGKPEQVWPLLLSSQPTRRAGTRVLRNNAHIPKSSTGYTQTPAPGQQGSAPAAFLTQGIKQLPGRCRCFSQQIHIFLFRLSPPPPPLGSSRGRRTGRFSPTSKRAAVRSLPRPAQHPRCKRSAPQPGRGDAAVPLCPLPHRPYGTASPAPKGEHHAAAGAAPKAAGCLPGAGLRRHESFLWSLSPWLRRNRHQASRRWQRPREPTQGSSGI